MTALAAPLRCRKFIRVSERWRRRGACRSSWTGCRPRGRPQRFGRGLPGVRRVRSVDPAVHIGQFAGTLLIVSRGCWRWRGPARAKPGSAGALPVLVAPPRSWWRRSSPSRWRQRRRGHGHSRGPDRCERAADQAAGFRVAGGVRSVEKALAGFFQLLNGMILVNLEACQLHWEARTGGGWAGPSRPPASGYSPVAPSPPTAASPPKPAPSCSDHCADR